MASTIVSLLAGRPEPELRQMESKLKTERARLEAETNRVDIELGQVAEALALQARRAGGRSPRAAQPARPGATQARILDAVARFDHPVSPAQIIATMEADGPTSSRGSIHNTIGRLVKNGHLVRLGEGQYQLASRNGSSPESNAGPTENESTEPLLAATEAQEAS